MKLQFKPNAEKTLRNQFKDIGIDKLAKDGINIISIPWNSPSLKIPK